MLNRCWLPRLILDAVMAAVSWPVLAVEPGVAIAVPRVAVSTVDSTLSFKPARLVVEQDDHVRWSATVASIHTTTSGANCLADGLWNASLGVAGSNFTRQFNEPPQTRHYFCSPHCGLGMVGQVVVTTLINLTMTDTAGTSNGPLLLGNEQTLRRDAPSGVVRRPPATTVSPPTGPIFLRRDQ